MKLSNLPSVLRDAGLTVVETAGWSNRGYAGQDLQAVAGVLWHHTATHRSRFASEDAPTLSMCINGRSDLAGPLCNIVFGRDGTVYLVAAGVANHAGAGSAAGIPVNMGNHYLIGIEMESSGIAPWDWTDDQLRVAPYLGAALERAYSASLQIAHYEYSSQGKIDPAGWPGGMDGLRDSINAVMAGSINYSSTTYQEDDLPYSRDELKQIIEEVVQPKEDITREYLKDRINDGVLSVLNGQQAMEDVTRQFLADRVRESSPAEIAALVPDAIAQQVIDALASRLGGK